MQNIEFFIDYRNKKRIEMFKIFKTLYAFFLQNRGNTFFGIAYAMIIFTFFSYNSNFNENKSLILKHVDYVYDKTEENLTYTRTLISAEKTFFNRMCGYYETISSLSCVNTQSILKVDK